MAGVAPAPYRFQFFDNAGNPLSGGKVDVYLAGTTTRTNTWSDRAQTTLNANPIGLDSAGRASIVLDTSKTYKFVVKTSAGITLYTDDNIIGAAGLTTTADALADIESARVAAIADVDTQGDTSVAAVQSAQATATTAVDNLVTEAETAKTLAEAARDLALGYSKVYTTTAQGISGTSDGQRFVIRTADLYTFTAYYNNAGVATSLGTVYLANGQQYTQDSSTGAHWAFADSAGETIGYWDDDGLWIWSESAAEYVLMSGYPNELEVGSGTGTFALQDNYERVLMAQDNKGRWAMHGLGYVFDNIASNDIGTALVYEQFGSTAYKYFLADRAKSRLGHRINIHKNVVAATADSTSFARFPFYVVISDSTGLLLFSQRHSSRAGGEEEVRQVCKSVTIDRDAGTITVGSTVVIDESAAWTAGTGGNSAGAVGVRITSGVNAGRIVIVYNKLISVNELFTDASYERALYTRYSTDNGATWSAATKIMGAAQIYNVNTGGSGGVPNAVPSQNGCMTGTGNCIFRIPSGTYAGRIVCSLYTVGSGAYIGSMYSDDDGVTWTRGTLVSSPGGKTYNESALTYCSDGSLVMLMRCENNNGTTLTSPGSGRMTSSDGGATWTYQGHVSTGFGNSSHALLNASIAASTGFEKQLAACTEDTALSVRSKHSLKLSYDKGATWVGEVKFFDDKQGVGYGCLQRLSIGDYVFVYETFNGNGGINTEDSVGMIYFNEAELMAQAALI